VLRGRGAWAQGDTRWSLPHPQAQAPSGIPKLKEWAISCTLIGTFLFVWGIVDVPVRGNREIVPFILRVIILERSENCPFRSKKWNWIPSYPAFYPFSSPATLVARVAPLRQIVVSGPSGFVLYVENILTEMRVPSSAVVLLDWRLWLSESGGPTIIFSLFCQRVPSPRPNLS